MKRIFLAIVFLALFPIASHAQSPACAIPSTGMTTWTITQWQTCFNSLAPLTNPILVNPTIVGGAISGSTVQPAGGIGTIVTVDTNQATLALGVSLDQVVILNLASPANISILLPPASNWPACPSSSITACPTYVIKDGFGNASTYHITITAVDNKAIDGSLSAVISANYGSLKLVLNGTSWNVVSAVP